MGIMVVCGGKGLASYLDDATDLGSDDVAENESLFAEPQTDIKGRVVDESVLAIHTDAVGGVEREVAAL